MVFNCNHCRVEIKRNEESGEWQATESLPVPERVKKPYVFSSQQKDSFDPWKPRTTNESIDVWRSRVITFGWLLAGFNFFIIFFAGKETPFTLFVVAFNIAKVLIIAYFIAFLLECLAKHLKNQKRMIFLLEKRE